MNLVELDKVIYIGAEHTKKVKCTSKNEPAYELKHMHFRTRKGNPRALQARVIVCKECQAIFMPVKYYDKHWAEFDDYKFIVAKTGKVSDVRWLNMDNLYSDERTGTPQIVELETPEYIKYGITHPYYGGRMK